MNVLTPLTETERSQPTISLKREDVLLLNASFEPMDVLDAQRAICLLLEGSAEIIEADDTRIIRTQSSQMPYPAVIRLSKYVRIPRNHRKGVTNTWLFARDRYTCQYCGRHRSDLASREFLTRDHVKPQAWFKKNGGDPNTWDNCVTSCNTCNNRKADRTPAEAGMNLRTVPLEPNGAQLEWSVRRLTDLQKKYIAMFYGDAVLEAIS